MAVLIKNMDEELYKQLKAKAALMGITVSEAIQSAIRLWLNSLESIPNENYIVMKTDKNAIEAYERGKYVLVCDGKFIGSFDSEEEVINTAKSYNKCMIGNITIDGYIEHPIFGRDINLIGREVLKRININIKKGKEICIEDP
ncbi:ribbon-helix-helix protein, CopG family [Acidianus manzaensis]|uniref:ribbon-helix-helix protein, CopG family n=1 Tax=Acidianus manzaensis TaxID=282676 RepID=UPI001C9BD42F|nr:ribbon-helix-helix domain-containing protein [Acidianus manzaensis]